ncbi:hypothetical protein HYQ45_005768 [Verticillium longisporum]|uniref:DUF7707 domain-containing protein n=1 Tax=Verticillium longisporum TaxID=100787 RepID=A0A0G4MMC8_VERLO|nr:hypothetical protein HYQ44_000628 [Verticillium longisporum]KAG7136749.1 hypothetical protein HYQ45_005768 [Verticillium longisporum]CRK31228.1 hypothetical protein BN1723_014460 [Verticillium longisporum]CRK35381.1 hypothetical protein BN1708_006714 [Verticillium longisporum]
MRVATTFALALSAAATLVSAQRKVYNASDLNDINNISDNERASWCSGQRNVCDELCNPAPTNNCDYQTLQYECLCSNGTAPGLQYYSDSLPTYICNRVFSECNAAAVGNANAQRTCLQQRDSVCGADALQNAFANAGKSASTTTTASASASTAASQTSSVATDAATTAGSADGASETTTTGDSFAAPTAAPMFGAAAIAVAALAYVV